LSPGFSGVFLARGVKQPYSLSFLSFLNSARNRFPAKPGRPENRLVFQVEIRIIHSH